jgi:hypothetical protein
MSRFIRNQSVHHRVHNSPSLNGTHSNILTAYHIKIRFNIILLLPLLTVSLAILYTSETQTVAPTVYACSSPPPLLHAPPILSLLGLRSFVRLLLLALAYVTYKHSPQITPPPASLHLRTLLSDRFTSTACRPRIGWLILFNDVFK